LLSRGELSGRAGAAAEELSAATAGPSRGEAVGETPGDTLGELPADRVDAFSRGDDSTAAPVEALKLALGTRGSDGADACRSPRTLRGESTVGPPGAISSASDVVFSGAAVGGGDLDRNGGGVALLINLGFWMRGAAAVLLLVALALAGAQRVSEVSAYPLNKQRLTELARRPFWHNDTRSIAVVRVPDTPGIRAVEQYITGQLAALGDVFRVEVDVFAGSTPLGTKTFRNIVATVRREASAVPRERRVVVAAHYDSKLFASGGFVGATDSAVPCAMLLDLARMVSASDTTPLAQGLQLVFFDGEEAFGQWSATDSLYGARHLAGRWVAEGSASENSLDKIALFMLLDLIGVAGTKFGSLFPVTALQFKELVYYSRRLKKLQLLHNNDLRSSFFDAANRWGAIEDDHVPFLQRGVPVLHLISTPFPPAWHTEGDNVASLDEQTIEDLATIFRAFLASILNLTRARPASNREL
jgi:glutaminyl-peptide cyclotransferase